MNFKRTISSLCLIVITGVCAAYGQAEAVGVTGSFADSTITRGTKARVFVVMDIPSELHTNSNKPKSEYLIPTTVRVAAPDGIKVSPVNYPAGHDRRFGFSENELNVYEGKVEFSFDVTVPKAFRGDTVSVEVTVRYQACTDEVCYPPKSKKVTLTAPVK